MFDILYVINRVHYLYTYAFVLICVRQCIQFFVKFSLISKYDRRGLHVRERGIFEQYI